MRTKDKELRGRAVRCEKADSHHNRLSGEGDFQPLQDPTVFLECERVKPRPSSVGVHSVPPGDEAFALLNQVLNKWFHKPDLQAIRIVLGTVKAHYLNVGDPAWLFIVAPPGTGKTTTSIMSSASLPQVITLGDLSENTFLSGFYGHREPGLLEKLGKTTQQGTTYTTQGDGILLVKDFTTVLSMRREKRSVILSQLREIHDGEFRRDFGTGETKIWRGRVSVIAAVTPALDRHYSIFSTLGERFLQVRWHRPDSPEAGKLAIHQQGKEAEIQKALRERISEIFAQSLGTAPALDEHSIERIASLAELIAIGRTHVYRESCGNRDIEFVPEAEANTRISKGLAAVAKGIAALNRHQDVTEEDLQDAFRVGLDCLPEIRHRIVLSAIAGKDLNSVALSATVLSRTIEDLAELKILEQTSPHTLTDNAESLLSTAKVNLLESSQTVRGG